jgi:hypothetical protein
VRRLPGWEEKVPIRSIRPGTEAGAFGDGLLTCMADEVHASAGERALADHEASGDFQKLRSTGSLAQPVFDGSPKGGPKGLSFGKRARTHDRELPKFAWTYRKPIPLGCLDDPLAHLGLFQEHVPRLLGDSGMQWHGLAFEVRQPSTENARPAS